MRTAIWTITRNSGEVALKLKEKIQCDVYLFEKYFQDLDGDNIFNNLDVALEKKFCEYDAHIFLMATGIVVRKISKLLQGKDKDPAVVVIDENLNFVIPLVSGHLGGANEFAEKLGKLFNLVPIVTTNSDITGKIAVDTLSQKLNCQIENLEAAKKVTALIVDGKNVELKLPENVKINEISENSEGVVIISNRENLEISRIYPKNLVIGIGCRLGVSSEKISDAVYSCLKKYNLSPWSIKKIATVDVKKNEEGLLKFTRELGFNLEIIERSEIEKIQEKFIQSDFVQNTIGVKSVSAPCAFLASSKNGKFLVEKYILNGVTVSVYEENNIYEKR